MRQLSTVKEHYYSQHAGALRAELGAAISREEMRELHRKQPLRHFAVAVRQFAVLAIATWALIRFDNPLVWIPIALIQGFTVFNFTILLHEVVHHTIFERRRAGVERLLGFLYAIPSGISASQFTRWHLDHHAELGSDEDDPKRHHLSPKVNARWYKLLYCTPALFPIYFRAARREASTYPEPLQRAIARERKLSMLFHLSALALIWYGFGFYAALRASIIPVFFIFPIAFTLNRLGQHYDIDPTDPAKWGTLMRRTLVLGLRLPQLELPPRAPLLPGRAVLSPARSAARAAAVLREEEHALADLRRARLRVAGREPGAAYELGRGANPHDPASLIPNP